MPDAVRQYQDAAARGEGAALFPEAQLNLLGYTHLQAGRVQDAIKLFELNTMAYPGSANTYDSLADGYLAAGENDLALRLSRTALERLEKDNVTEARKKAIRDSAEQRIARLTKEKK